MPRVRSNVARLKRKKQVMKAARGAFGARSKLWKAAKENVERGWKYAYRHRCQRFCRVYRSRRKGEVCSRRRVTFSQAFQTDSTGANVRSARWSLFAFAHPHSEP